MAKNGKTIEASNLLKNITLAHNGNPDTFYLKGIIELYSGDSAKAKKIFPFPGTYASYAKYYLSLCS